MSIECRTEEERLVAEQAIAVYREVQRTMEEAPHGQGLACTEAALVERGRAFLRLLMEQVLSTHAEVQKGGSAAGRANADARPRSSTTRRRR